MLAWFYHEPRLKDITFLVSLTFLIGGLRVQHDALLRRQMRFKSLAIRDVTSYVLAVPVAITMAWRGAGYWAIVALPLTLNLTQMSLSWLMVRWIPGLPRRDAKVRSLIAFGGNVAASYLVFNVNRSADSILIGWYWGAGPLGLYSRAYNLLMLPVRQLGAPGPQRRCSSLQQSPGRSGAPCAILSAHREPDHVDHRSNLRLSFCCRGTGDCPGAWESLAGSGACFPDPCHLCIGATAA